MLSPEKRYWLLVPIAGVVSGCLSVAFSHILAFVQSVGFQPDPTTSFLEGVQDTSPLYRVLIPTVGGIIVVLLAATLPQTRRAPGTSGLIEALAVKKGRLSLRRALTTSVSAVTAVGAGASLGREGPLIQSGAALASWLGRILRLEEHQIKVLLACGAAGGIAATYNAPIAAAFFAMEILLGSFAPELFGPIIVCSVIATAIARTYGLVPAYVVPEYQSDTHIALDLGLAIALGISIGIVAALFVRVFTSVDNILRGLPLTRLKPVLVMALLGLASIAYPALLGNGYDTVNGLLDGEVNGSINFLLLLCLLKILFTALCRAGGIPGGLFTPSLFVGALLGSGFAMVVTHVLTDTQTSIAKYALLGMGAILAGTMKAPITAVLMVFELTESYSVILPLMAACLTSAFVSHFLVGDSLFTAPLRKMGVFVPMALAPTWIRQPTVSALVRPEIDTVSASERFEAVVDRFLRTPLEHDRLYVVDDRGAYHGVISLHEIKLFIRESKNLDTVIAADVMNSSFPTLYAQEPVSRAVELFSESDAERLPVLENAENRRLVGSVSKRRILVVYRESNLARVDSGNEESP
jgi:CIC family chloride channel protein